MSFERRIAVVAGLATIASALMYAVDNQWFEGVPELRTASKTIEVKPPLPALNVQPRTSTIERAALDVPRTTKRSKRRAVARKVTRRPAKRRTVNIFAAAKDIPVPNMQR